MIMTIRAQNNQDNKRKSLHVKRLHPKLELNIIVGLKRLEQNVAREECHHCRKTSGCVHVNQVSGAFLSVRLNSRLHVVLLLCK